MYVVQVLSAEGHSQTDKVKYQTYQHERIKHTTHTDDVFH